MRAILSASEMPVSFTGQALFFAARTKWLGPKIDEVPNDVGVIGFWRVCFRVALKGAALTAYSVATAILCAPLGVLYHAASALRQKVISHLSAPNARAHADALAWEHFKAMLTDVSGIALVFLGGFYMLSSRFTNRNKAIGWWFSSTHVRTGYNGPPLVLGERVNYGSAKYHWGKEESSVDQCSYQKMRIFAVRKWEEEGEDLPLNHEQILFNICEKGFGSSRDQNALDGMLPAQPVFHSQRYACMKGTNEPAYQMHWATALKIIGFAACAILSVGYGIWFTTTLLPPLFTANLVGFGNLAFRLLLTIPVAFAKILSFFQISIGAYRYAVKQLNEARAPTEIALSYRLATKPLADAKKEIQAVEALKNSSDALFWLKAAALRGNRQAQRELGLCLLAAISRWTSPEDIQAATEETVRIIREKRDLLVADGISGDLLNNRVMAATIQHHNISEIPSADLPMIREALSWLQAAAINDDEQAASIVESILYFPPDRYFRGISGNTEEARMRSLLEGFGHKPNSFNEAMTAFRQPILPGNENEEIEFDVNARTAISKAIAESRKQLYALAIKGQAPEPLQSLNALYEIVADYLVGFDSQSSVFPPTPLIGTRQRA